MKWRRFRLTAGFLAITCLFASRSQKVEAAGEGYPTHVSATLKGALEQVRKTFRRDAVITGVELQGTPGLYWLGIGFYSPSNGATLGVQVGGPNNGAFVVGMVEPDNRFRVPAAIPPEFNLDLPDAIASVRKAGLKGGLGSMVLRWAGACGTPPVLVWAIRVTDSPIMFPLFVNAQDGKLIGWQRAMDPPGGSDAELKAAWDRMLNRNQSNTGPSDDQWRDCVVQIQLTGNCAP